MAGFGEAIGLGGMALASLFVVQGRDQGIRFELPPITRLGRDPDNQIQLHDGEVSRHHAEIHELPDGGYELRDLGSSNGTFVNAVSVRSRKLQNGDHVQLGGSLLLFTWAPKRTPPASGSPSVVLSKEGAGTPRILSTAAPESRQADQGQNALAEAHLRVVYDTAMAVSHTLDIDQLLHRLLELIFAWVQADRGCIMLVEGEKKELAPKVRRDRFSDGEEHMVISRTILDYVIDNSEGVRTTDARGDVRWDPAQSIVQHGVREAICVPMRGRYGVVGVIYIDTTTSAEDVLKHGAPNRFSDEHLKLMVSIAHQAALAVEDTNYYSAMVQSERLAAVGQTIAMLSHHIKNILQGVRGASFLIEDGLKRHDEEVVRKGWRLVERNQEKIYNLVMDMLTFSKEREPEMIPGDLRQVAVDVVELMQVRAKDCNVSLSLVEGPAIPESTFDPEAMHRALLNVVINALDACRDCPNAVVEVSTRHDPYANTICLCVRDTGEGIAQEDLDKLFQLFFSKKGGRGTGLGLTVSHKILKEHGGNIRVESRPGVGSLFTLEVPIVAVANQTMMLESLEKEGLLAPQEDGPLSHFDQEKDDSGVSAASREG